MTEPTAEDQLTLLDADAIQLAQLALEAGCISEGEEWLDKLDERKQDEHPHHP